MVPEKRKRGIVARYPDDRPNVRSPKPEVLIPGDPDDRVRLPPLPKPIIAAILKTQIVDVIDVSIRPGASDVPDKRDRQVVVHNAFHQAVASGWQGIAARLRA
jgi:hypothetical protein